MSYSEQAIKIILAKADRKMESAEDSYKAERYDCCISDLYYSAFQHVMALLIKRGEGVRKHTQVRAFINRDQLKKVFLVFHLRKCIIN